MPESTILNVLGVEREIRAWRGTNNKFRVTMTQANGDPVSLTNRNVIFTVTDRAGGTVKYTETKGPGDHTDAAGGVTIVTLPETATTGLTGQRTFTWKYQIVSRDLTMGEPHVHFYGDVRVLAPNATV